MGHRFANHRRTLSEAEAAWVGAMIEAEGTVGFSTQKGQEYPYIAVANTDLEIISALLRFVGGGRVSLKTAYVNKRVWVWTLAQWNNLAALVPQIRPWMTDKGDKLGRWF